MDVEFEDLLTVQCVINKTLISK